MSSTIVAPHALTTPPTTYRSIVGTRRELRRESRALEHVNEAIAGVEARRVAARIVLTP
ncbi:MAG TPA: hypothetical protein VGF63_05625 [Solirubrobacteraceae bacterium]